MQSEQRQSQITAQLVSACQPLVLYIFIAWLPDGILCHIVEEFSVHIPLAEELDALRSLSLPCNLAGIDQCSRMAETSPDMCAVLNINKS